MYLFTSLQNSIFLPPYETQKILFHQYNYEMFEDLIHLNFIFNLSTKRHVELQLILTLCKLLTYFTYKLLHPIFLHPNPMYPPDDESYLKFCGATGDRRSSCLKTRDKKSKLTIIGHVISLFIFADINYSHKI